MTRLAIVSPCFNEEEALPLSAARICALLDSLAARGLASADSFWLMVDDGSADGTWAAIERLHAGNGVRFRGVRLAGNRGHQSALMAGMMAARGLADAVVSIDADLQDDLGAVPRMLELLAEGNDVVYGVKVSREADPLMKRASAVAFYKLQAAMGVRCVFNHADFRLLSRRALDILSGYEERNLYLRALIPTMGLRSATVEDSISERAAGVSKYTLRKMLSLALDGITSFSVQPIYCIFYTGLLFLLVGLGIGIYVLHALIAGTAVPGWSSLILSIWFTSGVLMMSIGIIGVYIGKIYKEVKRRPLYNIAEELL